MMSGKTIRRYVDKDAQELKKFFPFQGRKRRKREVKTDNGMRGYEELPFAAAIKTRMGDLEVDLIVCSQSTESILSVRERLSRRVFLRKVPNRKAKTLRQALFRLFSELPAVFLQTALYDRDKAFSDLEALAKYFNIEHYACDPYCSWQKGAVENGNAQVRRFIPSGTDLSTITPERLLEIERWINITPMPVIGDLSPIQFWEYELKCFRDSLH
jgi:IS30 family transposase